jgi:hypothetical protein
VFGWLVGRGAVAARYRLNTHSEKKEDKVASVVGKERKKGGDCKSRQFLDVGVFLV